MNNRKCLPFYHPTRVVFVDDDPAFLNLVPLRLASTVPFLRFDSPYDLLEELSSARLQAVLDLDWWDAYPADGARGGVEEVVALDRSALHLRVFNRVRFGLVSVLVIDYQMPEMTGLDLCRKLAHLPCKRILLTGQADEALAVRAFNEGLIDLYLPKLHPRLDEELNLAIQRFQFDYLEQATDLIRRVLQSADPVVWGDAAFARFFHRLCEERGAVEYYTVHDPKGYLLVDVRGRGELLLLFEYGDLAAQCAAAIASRAPEEVIRGLEDRRAALYFGRERGDCVLSPEQWQEACVPLRPVPGRDDLHYALIGESRPFEVSPETVLGLRQYLDL
jgi:CheY-like chemotaxis protein